MFFLNILIEDDMSSVEFKPTPKESWSSEIKDQYNKEYKSRFENLRKKESMYKCVGVIYAITTVALTVIGMLAFLITAGSYPLGSGALLWALKGCMAITITEGISLPFVEIYFDKKMMEYRNARKILNAIMLSEYETRIQQKVQLELQKTY